MTTDSASKNLVKVFVAFPVPSIHAEELKIIQQRNAVLNGIHWTPLPNLHVTLFFLGEVFEESIPDINIALLNVTEYAESFNLKFEKIVLTGKKKYRGMIWVRFFKKDSFTNLSMNLHQAVKSFLINQPVLKDSIPHITLARIKKDAEIEKIDLSFANKFSLPEIKFCELWKSIQTKEGVIYKPLERFEFKR